MEELCDRLYKFEPRGNDSDPIDDLDLFELSEGDLNPIDDLDLDLCEPLGKDSDSVNDFMSNYDKLSSIVDSFPELQKNFKGTVRDLRKLGISKERYLEERETQIFNNTMAQYDGEKRILICIGSSHILDSSPLIKLIEEEGIPHLKFINYLKE